MYFCMPPTTDRTEKINRQMGHVYLKPIDVKESGFVEGFDPSVLDIVDSKREEARECVLKVMKKMAEIGNLSLKRNADILLSKLMLPDSKNILWSGERILEGKYALTVMTFKVCNLIK